MPSWKLTKDFNEQSHLFHETIFTDYIIEAFYCSCGHSNCILKYKKQILEYMCDECGNNRFYNANDAWNNIEHFLSQNEELELSCEYDIYMDNTKLISSYITFIPNDIDFMKNKVVFSKKDIGSVTLTSDGDLTENYVLKLKTEIFSTIKQRLVKHVNDNRSFNIPDIGNRYLDLKMIIFFLSNKNLIEFDFYYWEDVHALVNRDFDINGALMHISNYRKEKSIKKTLYQNYKKQMSENGRFYSAFIKVFTRSIQDSNVVVKLLNLNLDHMLNNSETEDVISLIVFLKKHYTEKQILKLFSELEYALDDSLFIDMLRELSYADGVIRNKFKKVACKLVNIHDEFVRCSKEERFRGMHEQKLQYSKNASESCVRVQDYEVRLPCTGQELYDWSESLDNCMAGYFDSINYGDTIIYGFFKDDTLAFAVEISDREIVQASGKRNRKLSIDEQTLLSKWFKTYY